MREVVESQLWGDEGHVGSTCLCVCSVWPVPLELVAVAEGQCLGGRSLPGIMRGTGRRGGLGRRGGIAGAEARRLGRWTRLLPRRGRRRRRGRPAWGTGSKLGQIRARLYRRMRHKFRSRHWRLDTVEPLHCRCPGRHASFVVVILRTAAKIPPLPQAVCCQRRLRRMVARPL